MRRGHAAGDEEGGEGYFASVSDLMVGVLFVFLLMLTVFALNFRDAEQAQMVAREIHDRALSDLDRETRKAKAEAEKALAAQAEAERQEKSARRQAKIDSGRDGVQGIITSPSPSLVKEGVMLNKNSLWKEAVFVQTKKPHTFLCRAS